MIGVGNYVSASPSELGNCMSADSSCRSATWVRLETVKSRWARYNYLAVNGMGDRSDG